MAETTVSSQTGTAVLEKPAVEPVPKPDASGGMGGLPPKTAVGAPSDDEPAPVPAVSSGLITPAHDVEAGEAVKEAERIIGYSKEQTMPQSPQLPKRRAA